MPAEEQLVGEARPGEETFCATSEMSEGWNRAWSPAGASNVKCLALSKAMEVIYE